MVRTGDVVATVTDSVGKKEVAVRSSEDGIVIGVLRTALVHRGNALVHVARIED
jgi:predicted deacylase